MKWETSTLKKECEYIGRGISPKYVEKEGIIIINQKCIRDHRINFEHTKLCSHTVNSDKFLRKGDILINSTGIGTIGRSAQIKIDFNFPIFADSHLTIVRAGNNIYPFYLGYYINANELIIENLGKGTTQQIELSKDDLSELILKFPPLPIQKKIASILSAYDDLIENNLKRIKLLEETARLYYKEFLNEISSSKNLNEELIKDCIKYYIGGGWGEDEYKGRFTEPAYVIRGTDIPDVKFGNISDVPLRYHRETNLSTRALQSDDIVFEISNGQIKNIGRTLLITDILLAQFNYPVMCASFAKLIRLNEKLSPEYFYLFLNESQDNGLLHQYKSNGANGINNFAFEKFIEEVNILIPNDNEINTFSKKVKPIFQLMSILGIQNYKLREARDILLKKLITKGINIFNI